MNARHHLAALALLLTSWGAKAQCPQLYDYDGVPNSTPIWYNCSGTNFTLLVASPSSILAYTIDWGDGSPITTGASLVSPQSVGHPYAATVAQYTVTFTEVLSGCVVTGTVIMEESTSASIQIPVGGLTQVCAPQAVEFINSSTNVSPNTVFTWDFGDGTLLQTFPFTNLGQVLSHMYMPGTVSCETTVRLYAENSCNTLQGGPSVASFNPIRVWDLDSAQVTPTATLLCWPDRTVTFLNTTDRNCLQQGNIYQRYEYWNFGDYWGTGQDSIINWSPWPPTFPRTIMYPGIGSYDVLMLDSNYCGVDTAYITITIVPPPSVTLTVEPDTICAGETVFFEQTTIGGANYYQWNFGTGAGFQWTGAGDQVHAYPSPGTYQAQYTASIQGATAGCADTAMVEVVVLPSPTAQFTLDNNAACNSLTVAITNTSINGVVHAWDFGDGTFSFQQDPPPHTYGTVGDYTIALIVTNSDGCASTIAQLVHVYAPPQVMIGTQSVCVGIAGQFLDQTVTAPGNPVIQWSWDLGDGTTDSLPSPTHLYAGSGIYLVSLIATTPYCSSSAVVPVTVEAKPTAGFVPSDLLGCSPFVVSFANTSNGAVNYAWTFGDGGSSAALAPSHTFLNGGTVDTVFAIVQVVSTAFGCSDTAFASVTVAPAAVAAFAHNGMPSCAPLDVDFTNNSTGASTWSWDLGDGTTSTAFQPTHTYVNNTLLLQAHVVTLIVTSPAGCTDTTTRPVVVYPAADFSFNTQPDSGCSPLSVTFPAVVGAVTYQWDFGDGTIGSGAQPVHTYLNPGPGDLNHPITLVASNAFGCADTAYGQISVFPMPTAQFNLSAISGCHPLTATLTNGSSGATAFLWNYGDGMDSTTSAFQHDHTWYNFLGPGPSTWSITLTAATPHGCESTATAQVEVYPQVQAGIVADSVGCSPFDADFVNISTNAVSYLWTFGDGSGSNVATPSHLYSNQGLNDVLFTPSLVATSAYGCNDTASASILVHPQPIAQFNPSTLAGCQPLPVQFMDLAIGAVALAWQFGDGTTQAAGPGNVIHTYANTGTAPLFRDVVMVATSTFGCTDTATAQLQIYPLVTADFIVPAEGCSPFDVQLTDQGVGGSSWLWNMGDGTTLVGSSVTHTYVNTGNSDIIRTITLEVNSPFGCTDTLQQQVVVHPMPVASFQATPFTQQYPSATVSIGNTTANGSWSYVWDFSDGNTSTLEDPLPFTFGTWGSYMITLVVSNGICTDTVTQQVIITPPFPTASFIGAGEGCEPLTVSFTNTSLSGITYQWSFGDGGTSTADNPIYIWDQPGTYPVTLTAYGPGGTVNTFVKVDSIVVHPRASAYFILQPEEVIVPSQPVFTYNLSGNATDFQWDFGDGGMSTELNPVHYYTAAGEYAVQLIANNEWNCPDTMLLPSAVTGKVAGDLAFPNAFSPGNTGPTDGVYDPASYENDFFFPVYDGVQRYQLQVFNRWGELVFETTDIKVGWDGYYRGQLAKQDVYAWKARASFSDGRETTLSGDVTLIR